MRHGSKVPPRHGGFSLYRCVIYVFGRAVLVELNPIFVCGRVIKVPIAHALALPSCPFGRSNWQVIICVLSGLIGVKVTCLSVSVFVSV